MELCDYCIEKEADIILTDKTEICLDCFNSKAWIKIYKNYVNSKVIKY